MSANELQSNDDESPDNTAELLDTENPRVGFHARMPVEVEIPVDLAVTIASRLGVEAVQNDTAELPAERADAWALNFIELQPRFTVNGPEGEVSLADYLADRGVPIEPATGDSDDE